MPRPKKIFIPTVGESKENTVKPLSEEIDYKPTKEDINQLCVPTYSLIELISIRDYVVMALSNPTTPRPKINELNGTLILIDRMLIEKLTSNEFKEFIGYGNVKSAIADVAQITNIKSGLNLPKN